MMLTLKISCAKCCFCTTTTEIQSIFKIIIEQHNVREKKKCNSCYCCLVSVMWQHSKDFDHLRFVLRSKLDQNLCDSQSHGRNENFFYDRQNDLWLNTTICADHIYMERQKSSRKIWVTSKCGRIWLHKKLTRNNSIFKAFSLISVE